MLLVNDVMRFNRASPRASTMKMVDCRDRGVVYYCADVSILERGMICVYMAVTTVMTSDFIRLIHIHGAHRRVDERRCLLHPPMQPAEIARTSSQLAGEKGVGGNRSFVNTGSRRTSTPWKRGGA